MQVKLMRLILALVLLGSFCISCGSSEDKAQAKLNEALLLKGQQDFRGSLSLLKEVVSEYPETKASTEAAGELEGLRAAMMIHFKKLTEIGESSEAKGLWEIIKSEYPNSPEVMAARQHTIKSNDAAARADLMNAYTTAQAYFTDHADESITYNAIRSYGFIQSEQTKLQILNNTFDGLTMVSEHSDGNTAYAVYPDGHVQEFGFDSEYPTSLDSIARTVNASALSNAKNAYAAAQAYFADHPDGSVSLNAISRYGFRQTEVVSVSPGGTRNTLTIVTYHPAGDRTYTVTSDGSISNN